MVRPADWLVPDWPAPKGVQAVFTTREGGVSVAPFGSFNVGDHVRDDPAAVVANRERLREATGAHPVFLTQVHGVEVARLDAQTRDGTRADASATTQPGVACTVMVADCLPVLWCVGHGHQVAASHAGWRGLVGEGGYGILEATLAALTSDGATSRDAMVWLGPCIGPKAFEVGAEVLEALVAVDPQARTCFEPLPTPGKFLAHLPGLARMRLQAMGIAQIFGNDGSDAWCTVTQASRFFRTAATLSASAAPGAWPPVSGDADSL